MLKAIVFDCDGVIADTEPVHLAAFQTVLAAEGISLSKELYYREYLALDDFGCYSKAFADHGLALSRQKIDELIERKATVVKPVMMEHIRFFPGVVDFIRRTAQRI